MTVTPTMSGVAAAIDPVRAQTAVAAALATVGSLAEWDSQTIEWVLSDLAAALPAAVPSPWSASDTSALAFWSAVEASKGS